MLNLLVCIKPVQILIQDTLMLLKANTTDTQAILSYTNHDFVQTNKDDIMPSLIKEFGKLHSNIPKGSKLLFSDDINQCIMSISKTSKSIVKYQSQKSYDEKYSKINEKCNYHQKPVKNLQDLLENIKSSFQEEKQKSVLTKEVPSIIWFNINIVRGNNKYAGFTRKYTF